MITGIELRNWKTHGSTRLSFQKGVNVLIGVMGAGKSSVMDAISFALFGTFPALTHKRVKLDGVIKRRPARENEAEVRLSFVNGDDAYTVVRKLSSSGATTARLEKNGGYLQAQPIRVNEEIASILKVDYDTFARAVYSEQNGLDYFLTLAKGDRKRQMDNMLGLDQFATAEENCTSLINSIRSTADDAEAVLGRMDVASLKRQLEKASSAKKEAEEEQSALEAGEKEGRKRLAAIRAELDGQKGLFARREALAREVIDLRSRISTLRNEIEKIKAKDARLEPLESELDSLGKEERELAKGIERLREGERASTKALADLLAREEQNAKRIVERDAVLKAIGDKDEKDMVGRIGEEEKALAELVTAEAAAGNRKEETEEWVRELSRHLSRCPICERALDEESRKKLLDSKGALVKDLDKELGKLREQVRGRSLAVKKANDEYNRLLLQKSKLKDYGGVDGLAARLADGIAASKEEHRRAEGALNGSVKRMDSLKERARELKASIDTLRRKLDYEAEVRKHSKVVEEKSAEMDGIRVDQEKIDELQEGFTAQSAAVSDASAKVASGKKYNASLDSHVDEAVKQIDSIRSMEDDVARKRAALRDLNRFKAALVETEASLRKRLVESINSMMQEMWPELYPYGDFSRLRLAARPDDYILEADVGMDDGEEWEQVDAVASGGERNIACLALRIALAMVIVPNLRWLILDEPTHNVDANGIAKLINVFGDSLPRVVEQVFIITHDDDLKQIASARVYMLSRDKDAGGSTAATEL